MCAKLTSRLYLQDFLNFYLVNRMDIYAVRNDKSKSFFDLTGCDGANTAQAVEQNYMFVIELCATLAGAPSLPAHFVFKAGPTFSLLSYTDSSDLMRDFLSRWMFRHASTRWQSHMGCSGRGPGRRPSRILDFCLASTLKCGSQLPMPDFWGLCSYKICTLAYIDT